MHRGFQAIRSGLSGVDVTLILGIGRPSKGTTMKAFLFAAVLAFSTAIFAPNDARAGVSLQFGYGAGYYGHGRHGYGYRHYGYPLYAYPRYGYRRYGYPRYGYRQYRYRYYGYPTYRYVAPAYSPPSAAAAPVQRAPAPSPPEPYCREYTRKIVIDGQKQTAYGTACMQADGSWRLIN